MRSKKKADQIPKELKTPIVDNRRDVLMAALEGDETKLRSAISERHRRIRETKLEKLRKLANHYGLDLEKDGALRLALRLAEEFVPGFAVVEAASKKGRHVNWTFAQRMELVAKVESYSAVNGVSTHRACQEMTYMRLTGESLYRRYTESKKQTSEQLLEIERRLGRNHPS